VAIKATHPSLQVKQLPLILTEFADVHLHDLVKRMRARTSLYKEKLIDRDASSSDESIIDSKFYILPPLINCEEKKPEEEHYCDMLCCKFKRPPITKIIQKLKLPNSFDPYTDRFYISWLFIVSLAWNWNCWFIPLRWAFNYQTPSNLPYWLTMDYICDFIYVIDMMVFQVRLQFVKRGDIIVSFFFHYDLASVIPFDLLYLVLDCNPLFRMNRLLKYSSFFEFSDRVESLMKKAYLYRVVRTTGYLLYVLHINASLYFWASTYEGIGSTKWVYNGKGNSYLSCFLYAEKSLLMIGELPFPTNEYEQIFQICNYFFGALILSAILGQMRDVIGAATSAQNYFRSSMDNTVHYMNINSIPKIVHNRVRTWYEYTWKSQGILDESELLEQLPSEMRLAIAMDVSFATVSKIDLFKVGAANQSHISELVNRRQDKLKLIRFSCCCSLLSGGGGNRRTANVAAHGFANLFILEKRDLNEILVNYPDSQKILRKKTYVFDCTFGDLLPPAPLSFLFPGSGSRQLSEAL
uniref:Cyclic nucleotide gated channel subunit beta 3 n=1 Tax=Callorhinchus milii TaxID=7868 RepID=A0A4W3IGE4_CALMI